MSGVAKGVGKVFKAVGSLVKRVAPIAIPVAAAIGLGGLAAPMMGGLGTAAGAAGATAAGGAAAGGLATVGAAGAAGATGLASTAAGIGGGLAGFGQLMSNPMVGQVVGGAARGFLEKARLQDEEEALQRRDQRVIDSYEGAGDAMAFGATGPGSTSARNPEYETTRFDQPKRKPRFRYDPERGNIVYD